MSEKWYLYKDQQQRGPYSFEQLAQEARQGLIGPADLVWHQGLQGWVRASQVEQLLPAAQQPRAAGPTAYANQGISYQDDTKLLQLRSWLGFVGIITVIGGAISAISGLFALIIGAIPGIITVILGVKLLGAKKSVNVMLEEGSTGISPATFDKFIESLRGYFKLMGILIIISLIFSLLLFIFGTIASFALPGLLDNILNMIE